MRNFSINFLSDRAFATKLFVRAMFSVLLLPCALTAEPEPQLQTVSDYLQKAQSDNPGLKAFVARYEATIAQIDQVSALPDPTLQITHFVDSVQTRTGPQENVVMLSQKLPWFGKLDQRKASAEAEAEALQMAYKTAELQLARNVAFAFFEFAQICKAIDLTRENLSLVQNFIPVVEQKVRGGNDLNSLIRIKVEVAKLSDKLETLKQNRIAQSAQIQALLALKEDPNLSAPVWDAPDLPELYPDNLIHLLNENNPELAMLKSRINSASARYKLSRLARFPDVTLGVNYIQIGQPEVNRTTPKAGEDAWGVTIAVNLPIWGDNTRGMRDEALFRKRAAENDYDQRRNELHAELMSSLTRLQDAQRRINLYGTELLGLARQSLDNSLSSYENGRTGILEVIDSQRTLLDLNVYFWRAAADAWQEQFKIATLVGSPDFVDLPQLNENARSPDNGDNSPR